jgi:hypothetical protein
MAPERATAEILVRDLAVCLSGLSPHEAVMKEKIDNMRGKLRVTKKNFFVARIACGWLISHFIDSQATFKFVSGANYIPEKDEVRFDMFDGEFTHEVDRCTFEVMISE